MPFGRGESKLILSFSFQCADIRRNMDGELMCIEQTRVPGQLHTDRRMLWVGHLLFQNNESAGQGTEAGQSCNHLIQFHHWKLLYV